MYNLLGIIIPNVFSDIAFSFLLFFLYKNIIDYVIFLNVCDNLMNTKFDAERNTISNIFVIIYLI